MATTTPMPVDSGCGSSSEEESRPLIEATENQEPKPLRNALEIIEVVQKSISNSVVWNMKQCTRLADRYIAIAEMLKRMDRDRNFAVGDGGDTFWDDFIHVLQKGMNLILGYDRSHGITNVICRTDNRDAFEEHHDALDVAVAKLGLQGMEDAPVLTSEMEKKNMLKADAEEDKKDMSKLILSQTSNAEKVAQVVSEKTTDLDVEKLAKDDPERLPSYLKISREEIELGPLVRPYERNSQRDPKNMEDWARVHIGRWINYDFAIKVFKCKAEDGSQADWNQKQLLMEVGSLVELQHPHIVRLVGFGQNLVESMFVMELVDGDLRHFMKTKANSTPDSPVKPFTDSKELDIIDQIAKGMCFIHSKGFAHGDLKCSNIMVKSYEDQYLDAKIGDLRGSQKRGHWNAEAFKQASETRRPRWTAPEAIDHYNWVQPSWELLEQSDIYSFGMTCYEIVTGNLPFQGMTEEAELVKWIKEGRRPTLPESLDEDLKGLITSCWRPIATAEKDGLVQPVKNRTKKAEKDPEQRPSFEEICQILAYIRSKTPAAERSRLLPVMLNQFTEKVQGEGNDQASVATRQSSHRDTDVRPEDLRIIPEYRYLEIHPERLTRGPRIGTGASARVYKTTWLSCTFAEKEMRRTKSHFGAVKSEVEFLIKVSRHPCMVQIVGLSIKQDGMFSIVMEYMEGDLEQLIGSRMRKRESGKGPFDLHEEVDVISKIALGMAYLHSRGVVHRDLKTRNVLAEDRFGIIDVKIADFGLSHFEEPLECSDSPTAMALEFYGGSGTRFYRAPEMSNLAPGEDLPPGLPPQGSNADLAALKAADVFSFGMTCYEVLTGTPCSEIHVPECSELHGLKCSELHGRECSKLRGLQTREASAKVRNGHRPKWPTDPDPELESLVKECWRLIPEDRPTFDCICKELLMIQRRTSQLKLMQFQEPLATN